jgi:hypothetical protein
LIGAPSRNKWTQALPLQAAWQTPCGASHRLAPHGLGFGLWTDVVRRVYGRPSSRR